MKLTHDVKETIVRSEDPGPAPEIECAEDGNEATATWIIPEGQLLTNNTAPAELATGGYVYFTPHDAPTAVIRTVDGDELIDFSGANLSPDTVVQISTAIEPGIEYRAHLLLAYEDGPTIHDDTVFVCDAPVPVADTTTATVAQPTTVADAPVDTLPMTGVSSVLLSVALVLVGAGAILLRLLGGGER